MNVPKYEYLTFRVFCNNLREELNEKGEEGWELVSKEAWIKDPYYFELVMKRQVIKNKLRD